MKVFFYVDKDKCIGCGACVLISDKLFRLDGDKAKELKKVVDNEEERELVLKAARSCPSGAIVLEIIEE